MSNSSLEEQRPSFEDDSTVATSSQQQNTTNQSQSDSAAASMCTRCQKPATYMCSSCGLTGPRYCSVDCQKVDWKEKHGSVCQATIAARQSRRATRMTTTTAQTAIGDSNNTNTGGDIALNDLTAASSRTAREDNNGEDAGMILFYMQQIYYVIKPVVACIVLSIFWVKVSFSGSSDYKPTRSSYGIIITSDTTTTASSAGDGGGGSGGGTSPLVGSLVTALIIIGQIILVTVVILFLFKKGWMKALVGFFMIVVLLLLGFMTYLLLLNVIQVFLIPMDYITMSFALWNFTVVGLVSVFYAGPLWLQQSYLTVMSSLMAFSLTGLEEWTTWFLLGLLAIWDLIAVLCPFGPLRLLIESSRSQQRDVPALLYSVNAVWLMLASSNHLRLSKTFEGGNKATSTNDLSSSSSPLSTTKDMLNTHPSNHEEEGEEQDTPIPSGQRLLLPRTVTVTSLPDTLHSTTTSIASEYEASMSSTVPLQMNNNSFLTQLSLPSTTGTDVNTTTTGQIRLRAENTTTEHEIDRQVSGDQQPLSPNLEENGRDARRETRDNSNEDQENRRNSSGRDEDEERDGLKLGLGDFVFYSVLIARAALYDWITTICCTIAVLTGLTATIFLLAIYKRALPALPISIAFGVLFYFVAKTVLVPYISALCVFDMVGL